MKLVVVLPTGDWAELYDDSVVKFYHLNEVEFEVLQIQGVEGLETPPLGTVVATYDKNNGYRET